MGVRADHGNGARSVVHWVSTLDGLKPNRLPIGGDAECIFFVPQGKRVERTMATSLVGLRLLLPLVAPPSGAPSRRLVITGSFARGGAHARRLFKSSGRRGSGASSAGSGPASSTKSQ